MREKITKVYTFDELSEKAKERARQWWRDLGCQEFVSDSTLYEPYETAAKLLGIEFATHPVGLVGGSTRSASNIYWCSHVPGCGASFEGSYAYNLNCSRTIRREYPQDKELHAIADGLVRLQRENGYRITANVRCDGREVHKYAMHADVYKGDNDADADTSEALLELMRDFADWIYDGVNQEYDYSMSDECVDDAIIVNEYEFTEDGEIA